ncbi:hypothetical protein [Candidatus Finniella inopinata]|uniref:hypothetical protein n=1 Tax=Candidatus Finniella inopinata TaxID=1696036 RepID=UPI0013EEE330|nr:hypothetical protein [Candidatus Finniella inopinata]
MIYGFILSQAYVYASCDAEKVVEKQNTYSLKSLSEGKVDLDHFQVETKSLIEQGFPEKRAKEIYAHEQIKKIFRKKFRLVSAGNFFEKIGGACEVEFHKTDAGILDDIFTSSDLEWIQRGNSPLVYNEVHFVETEKTIAPFDLENLEGKDQYNYTLPSLNVKTGSLDAQIHRPCGILKASLSPLHLTAALGFQTALKTRLEKMRIGHTLTILKPDGTLTLFDVIRGE